MALFGNLFGRGESNGRNGKQAQAAPPDPLAGVVKHLRSALSHAYHEQVARLCSLPSASNFASQHLRESVLAERIIKAAEELMTATLRDKSPKQLVFREHDILLVRLDTLPGNSRTAPEYFTSQYGSYVAFQSGIVEAPEFRADGYKVFVHVVFGEEKRLKDGLFMPWGTIGLMPIWEANLTEWVAPRVCCNDKDRLLLGF